MRNSAKGEEGRRCVFCGDVAASNEHVWPLWIGEVIRERLGVGSWIANRDGRERRVPKLDAKVKRVCEPCNTRWMSALEGKAKPLLTPMMFAEHRQFRLSPADQRTLATWAFKTALMANFFHGDLPVSDLTYKGFYRDKLPPRHCTIWTTGYSGPKQRLTTDARAREFSGLGAYSRDGIFVADPGRIVGAQITLIAVWVVFQVLIYEGYHVPFGTTASPLQRIWPVDRTTIGWPPKTQGLSDLGVERLFDRRDVLRIVK